jgi:pimeloyl-ACP methyl ester carboxylesterase
MSTDLYSEVRGAGPVLLLIPGGNGDAGFYEPFAAALSGDFSVVAYDRRGFSRSPLAGPVDDNRLLDIDVDDARTLLKSVDDGLGYVFGSSAGAIVALHLLTRHPDDVRVVVAHEPSHHSCGYCPTPSTMRPSSMASTTPSAGAAPVGPCGSSWPPSGSDLPDSAQSSSGEWPSSCPGFAAT